MKAIILILNYIDVGAPLVTLFFFIKPFRRMSRELRYIFGFVCIQFLSNLVSSVFEWYKVSNYSIYAANIILSFIILSALFYGIISRVTNRIIFAGTLLFCICAGISIYLGQGIFYYNSILSALASFIITAYCLIYFYSQLVKDKQRLGLTESSFFWTIIGVFTYYTGSFFIFISYKYIIVESSNVIGILWRFHNLLLAVFCIYTIYALIYKKTETNCLKI